MVETKAVRSMILGILNTGIKELQQPYVNKYMDCTRTFLRKYKDRYKESRNPARFIEQNQEWLFSPLKVPALPQKGNF